MATATQSKQPVVNGEPSHTAELAALMRAGEALFPPDVRVYHDPWARHFVQHWALRLVLSAPPLARFLFNRADKRMPGIMGEALLRCRFLDEVLAQERSRGVDQYILLGTGYDSTTCRFAPGEQVAVFEVDEPNTLTAKQRILEDKLAEFMPHTRFVPCDFTRDRLSDRLKEAGLDPIRPSLISWLAVTMYIDEAAVTDTMLALREVAAPGSKLVFDYMHQSVLDGSNQNSSALMAKEIAEKRGEPWRFGLTPQQVGGWLEGFDFALETQLEAADIAARYKLEDRRSPADFMGVVCAVREGD